MTERADLPAHAVGVKKTAVFACLTAAFAIVLTLALGELLARVFVPAHRPSCRLPAP